MIGIAYVHYFCIYCHWNLPSTCYTEIFRRYLALALLVASVTNFEVSVRVGGAL